MNMKKILLALMPAMALMLTSCDPIVDEKEAGANTTVEAFAEAVTLSQAQAMANDIVFSTNPSMYIQVYDDRGNQLAKGTSGTFYFKPKRGSNSHQVLIVKAINPDGSVIECTKEIDVEVAAELATEMKLLVSDSGTKVWKWNPAVSAGGNPDACWGNGAYVDAPGENYTGTVIPSAWWGCNPEILGTDEQNKHAKNNNDLDNGLLYANFNATMVLDEDGNITTYSAEGNQITKGKFTVENYTGERHESPDADHAQPSWNLGILKVSDGGNILWPYACDDANPTMPTEYQIMRLTGSELILVYAAPGTARWGGYTWWNFKSESDAWGCLTDNSEKTWTWNPAASAGGNPDACWGNGAYVDAAGENYTGTSIPSWWGCNPEILGTDEQNKHAKNNNDLDNGLRYASFDATIVFGKDGNVATYDKDGKQITKGKFDIVDYTGNRHESPDADHAQSSWNLGTLKFSDGGNILWPYACDDGNPTIPAEYQIMRLTNDELILLYAAPGTARWGGCTWWNFKKK